MSRINGGEVLRPEHRLLELALPAAPSGAEAEVLRLWSARLDHGYLLEAGERVGALPLLGMTLARASAGEAGGVLEACHAARVRGAMRALLALRILMEVIAALRAAKIPCLVLKGLPLAYEIYSEPALRPIGDLDILVPQASVAAALESLGSLGFHPPAGSPRLGFLRQHHFHITLQRQGLEGLPLELHWGTQPYFSLSRIPLEALWSTVRFVPTHAGPIPVPGREVNLLYLAQHLMRHLLAFGPETRRDPVGALLEPARRGRLTWIADLMLLARKPPELDWERINMMSWRWGLESEIAGLRTYLAQAGAWPAGPGPSDRPETGDRLDLRAIRKAEGIAPGLSRPTTGLAIRPVLALWLWRFAFPGAAWIRWRYGIAESTRGLQVTWCAGLHATKSLGRAAWMAAAIALGRLQQRKVGKAKDESRKIIIGI